MSDEMTPAQPAQPAPDKKANGDESAQMESRHPADTVSKDADPVEVAFNRAIDQTPDERARFLQEVIRHDAELGQRVGKLLAAYEQAGDKLDEIVNPELQYEFGRLKPEEAGDTIGPYILREKLGEGGFGVVWVADQEKPVRRRVALKIIKLGMDTKEVIARFEQERQALALMDHPHIAKVLDAGATQFGRPFFVMELVRGIRITDYCDRANLPTTERLALFIQVCNAVQHAHQKGIIHRDLKPSNILVTLHNGVPVPKVIDFGVAKATQQQRLTDLTIYTQFQQMIGTPVYMSPEQAEMSGLDIDTRSDIYSLGVLLYELLTGHTPFDPVDLMKQGLDEIRRTIREVEPVTPSIFFKTMADETRSAVARHRQSEPAKLTNLLRGDLDWIVMKALEKDRGRRYESATGFGEDVQRHLQCEPVVARPPSGMYRFGRLVRRNRLVFSAGSAVAAALIVGLSVATYWYLNERKARESEAEHRKIADERRRQAEASEKQSQRLLYGANMNLAQQAWEKPNVGLVRQMLELTADSPTRGFEWYYWWRQTHLELKTLRGHTDRILSVAISRDGRRIATGCFDGTVKIWLVATGKELLNIKVSEHSASSVDFSPDGGRIVVGSYDNTIKVWDAIDGKDLLTLKGHTSSVCAAEFSPDGLRIATGSYDETTKLWDAATGAELLTINCQGGAIQDVTFSPNGERIATFRVEEQVGKTREHTVDIWETAGGKNLLTVRADRGELTSVAFSPDGERIVTGDSYGMLEIRNSTNGKKISTIKLSRSTPDAVVFSPDGQRIVAGCRDSNARVLDANTGKEHLVLRGHGESIRTVAISPDSQWVVTGSGDSTAKLWMISNEQDPFAFRGNEGSVTSVAFSPDGLRIATASTDATARIWDVGSRKEVMCFKGHKNKVCFVAFFPNGRRVISAGGDETVKIWETTTGKELLSFQAGDSILAAAISADGSRILTGGWSRASVWNAIDGKELMTVELPHEGGAATSAVAFNPNGSRIICCSNTTAAIFESVSGKKLFTISAPDTGLVYGLHAGFTAAAFSPDGKQVAACRGSVARVVDAASGKEILTLRSNFQSITSIAFSSDGERILTASREGSTIWDALTGRELLTLNGVNAAAFSSDGTRIVTGGIGNNAALIWDTATPQQVAGWQREEKAASK